MKAREMRKLLRARKKESITPEGTARLDKMMLGTQTQTAPQEYKDDLASAVSAISRGADAFKVYQRMATQYPQLSTELKRILLYTPANKRLEVLREALFGGE
jgi:hypothetical protein